MTSRQKWITLLAAAGMMFSGFYLLDAITEKAEDLCGEEECWPVSVETDLLAIYVVLASGGVAAAFARYFRIKNSK